jgi:lytic murein transglycosylase
MGDIPFSSGRWSGFFTALALVLSMSIACPAAAMSPSTTDRAFQAFVASLWPAAADLGVSRGTFGRAFAGISFDPRVVAQTKRQAEFVLSVWAYVGIAVSSSRVERGRAKSLADRPWLEKAKATYGVDPGVIMGVWGLETDFGGFVGSFDAVRSLASLAFVRFEGDYFRDELLAALVILEEGDIAPRALRGSWAGATGQTQFMPSTVLAYAVDFGGKGRPDIWTSEPDAIGSIANYLAGHGWKADLPWGFEVKLPPGFALTDADSSELSSFDSFAARGLVRANGEPLPVKGAGRLFMPAGLGGPVFVTTGNFDVIRSYNASMSYALAVALLGDAIEGKARLVASWPIKDHALTEDQVRRLQLGLKKMGYDPGEVDGRIGEALCGAVRKYQERNGLTPDGYPSLALLNRINAGN